MKELLRLLIFSTLNYHIVTPLRIQALLGARHHANMPCNFDPLTPHLYKVILGFTGVYIIFHFNALKHRLLVLVRTASMCTRSLCFVQKYEKYQIFHLILIIFSAIRIKILHRNVIFMIRQAVLPKDLKFKIMKQMESYY